MRSVFGGIKSVFGVFGGELLFTQGLAVKYL